VTYEERCDGDRLREPCNDTRRLHPLRKRDAQSMGLPKHKELWFRRESKDFENTILRPELYRPARGDNGKPLPLKPISKLLAIEDDLHRKGGRSDLSTT